jgi:peptidylprolyl isomerase
MTNWQQMTKAERRAAAKAAAAKAAAAKRRRQAVVGAFAGLAAVGVIVAAFVVFSRSDDSGSTAGAGGPTPGSDASPTQATFPPLPEGADPALGKKPTATAGTGNLTKLTVTPLIEGKGPAAKAGQTITVNYVGVSYKTGEEFDASWNRSQPFSFPLGAGRVIPGWDQGLVGAKVGSRVQLDIPSNLAYGENPSNGAPAGALRFIVDVLALR